ncbi:MAG: flippase-like domain-containing protein [Chloroflexota bacterium]|nr:flippase-like domain-containing protein [Chloroflexota bacterium]
MRRFLWFGGRLLVSGLLLYWFLSRVHLGALWNSLQHASPGWLALSNLLTVPVIVLVSWKWQILLRALGVRHGLWQLVRMNLVGGFYSMVLPGEETGQLAKGIILAKDAGDGDAVAASIVLDEILGTVSMFSIALMALAASRPFPLRSPIWTAMAVLWTVFVALLILALRPGVHDATRRAIHVALGALRLQRLEAWLDPFWPRMRSYHSRPRALGAAFGLTVAAHLLAGASVLATMRSVGVNISLVDVWWVVAAISALVTIPLTVSGLGIREGANVIVLGQLGVPASRALAVSLLALALTILWSAPGGLLQFFGSAGYLRMNARPIRARWSWLVPSQICVILASRNNRSTRKSLM